MQNVWIFTGFSMFLAEPPLEKMTENCDQHRDQHRKGG